MFKKLLAGAAAALIASTATASAEDKITAASCWSEGSFFSKRLEALINTVNEKGAGKIKIDYVGGAPAIGSPFTVVQKTAQGVYDLVVCTGAYYANVVPEADAYKLMEKTPAETRSNGGWDMMVDVHRKKNLMPVARIHHGVQFHLFLADGHKIDAPDLSGKHLRVVPIYTNFFKSLGATTQNSSGAQIFTLMENGTVNGYGWPVIGHQPGWETVTKYRVDPGFYDVDLQIIANARVWDGLSDESRALIESEAMAIEASATEGDPQMAAKVAAKQAAENFEIITFEGAEADAYIGKARDAGWNGLSEIDADLAEKLRPLFSN
ncbi:MAG: hypothetical protein AAFV19_16530 [Pseudomonadota bacterium]